jgi:PadR family transcriptional regulator PadR
MPSSERYDESMKPVSTSTSFLNGLPELLTLQLLSRRDMYGYEIVKAIQTQSQEAFSFGEGCIYPYLHYLEGEGFLRSQRRAVEGRMRTYYQITARGRKRLQTLAQDWDRVAEGVAAVMGGQYA